MDWVLFAVQWLHVVLAIFWFGGALYGDFVLVPAFGTLPLVTQQQVGAAVGARANRIIPAAAGAVILLGILRGTVFGQIKTFEALGTTYGITWLVALVFAIGTFLWGFRVIGPSLERLGTISQAEALNPDGTPTPALAALVAVVKRNVLLELVGFVVVFTCMILMRFGY
jgi:uncharacterized membrane protein